MTTEQISPTVSAAEDSYRPEGLPPHLAKQFGEFVLGLSDVRQFDVEERVLGKGTYNERTILEPNFNEIITEPGYDLSRLSEEAVEAAQDGKEHVERILTSASDMLAKAHDSLAAEGKVFGPKVAEADSQRDKREKKERDIVYKRAFEVAIASARETKANGDEQGTIENLESLLILNSAYRGKDLAPFRTAVRNDLAEQLLAAAQRSKNIVAVSPTREPNYNPMNTSGLDDLLTYATGKKINYTLKEMRRLDLDDLTSMDVSTWDRVRNIMAAAESSACPYDFEQIMGKIRSTWMFASTLAEQTDQDPSRHALFSKDFIIDLVLEASENAEVVAALKTDKPRVVMETASALNIGASTAAQLFARKNNQGGLSTFDEEAAAKMIALSEEFPEQADAIINNARLSGDFAAKHEDGGIGFDPEGVAEGLRQLGQDVQSSSEILSVLSSFPDASVTDRVRYCSDIKSLLERSGYAMQELPGILQANEVSIIGFVNRMIGGDKNYGSNALLTYQTMQAYTESYSKIEFPLAASSRDFYEKADLGQLPELKKRFSEIGFGEELAAEVCKSWATYDAYRVSHFRAHNWDRDAEYSELSESLRLDIARNQAKAIMAQLHAIEAYAERYGKDELAEIVNTFGIYNYSRYGADELHDQLERWRKGDPVRTAIVNTRADWNSFTKADATMEEGQNDGVFVFEANSGTEIARVAVMIGRHERLNGRTPDLKYFIIHAHGRPSGFLMGSSGEMVEVADYEQAQVNANKIGASRNDYSRHLGKSFDIVLHSCSTAGDNPDGKNIAETMSMGHGVRVVGSNLAVTGLTVKSDGTIEYEQKNGSGQPVVYDAG